MNLFVAIGKITEVNQNGRVLRFNLVIQQEKPCTVPCLIFDPSDETIKSFEQLENMEQLVSIQGRISSYEFEYQGKTRRKIEVLAYPNNIKPI